MWYLVGGTAVTRSYQVLHMEVLTGYSTGHIWYSIIIRELYSIVAIIAGIYVLVKQES